MTDTRITPSIGTLARMADTRYPDTEDGRGFLTGIYESVREAIEDDPEQDRNDAAAEIADSAIPVYTADLWRTFVDLAAWAEDPAEIGMDGSDMLKAAQGCLYLIASRLAHAAWDDPTEEADENAPDVSPCPGCGQDRETDCSGEFRCDDCNGPCPACYDGPAPA